VVGDRLKSSFACNILGAFEILYGDGKYMKEITADFDPSFKEAKSYIRGAKEDMEMGDVPIIVPSLQLLCPDCVGDDL